MACQKRYGARFVAFSKNSFFAFFCSVLGVAIAASSVSAVTYRMTVDNIWTSTSHPGAFPNEAHFSWFGGATHNSDVSFWNEGELASPAMKQMAETGLTLMLLDETNAAVAAGDASQSLFYPQWFCPAEISDRRCGPEVHEIEMEEDFPLLTLVSMLGPSPDWFVGVSGLNMRENGEWKQNVVVDLFPYDGGTRSANVLQLFGPLNDPPEPISLITTESGQIITPASLGTITLELIPEPSSLLLSSMVVGWFTVRRWESAA